MLLFYLFIFQLWILYTTAEFEQMENTDKWELYFSSNEQDCSNEGKSSRFPELYNVTHGNELGPPSNLTIKYFERPYVKISRNYFYPGMNLTIHPPETGIEELRGYEIHVTWKNRVACLIYVLNQTVQTQQEEITTELYPITEMMSFWFTLTSLPYTNTNQSLDPVQMVTSVGYYKNPRAILPEPADWYSPRIVYEVLRCNIESRCVQVIFARPPPKYGFQRYQIALVPVEYYINVRTDITSRFYHEFKDVEAGQYKIKVKVIDDFFSQSGRCLCHDGGTCTNCLSSETSIFVVD